jgi:hypothetical protein
MKDEDRGESCDLLSPEHEPEPRLDGPDESARFTTLNNLSSWTTLATTTHNKKYLAP